MNRETLHMRVGPLIGEQLLEITQTNISEGNVDYAMSVYPTAFGMTKEHAIMILKNQAVVVTDKDGEGVSLKDDSELIANNAHNIFDWELIINNRMTDIFNTIKAIHKTANDFMKVYRGDIENYSIINMMRRYFDDEQLKVIGKHNIAARIIGSPMVRFVIMVQAIPQMFGREWKTRLNIVLNMEIQSLMLIFQSMN